MDVQTIGLIGFALYMASYFLLQVGRLDGNGTTYCVLNLAAASCVLVSLTQTYNLPSVLIQVSWIAISVVGIARRIFWGAPESTLNFSSLRSIVTRSEVSA